MARRRAILTDRDRELLRGQEKSNQYYQVISRTRRKINEELIEDVQILEEHHPELLSELREVVCED
jgi:hypothetical protein